MHAPAWDTVSLCAALGGECKVRADLWREQGSTCATVSGGPERPEGGWRNGCMQRGEACSLWGEPGRDPVLLRSGKPLDTSFCSRQNLSSRDRAWLLCRGAETLVLELSAVFWREVTVSPALAPSPGWLQPWRDVKWL